MDLVGSGGCVSRELGPARPAERAGIGSGRPFSRPRASRRHEKVTDRSPQ